MRACCLHRAQCFLFLARHCPPHPLYLNSHTHRSPSRLPPPLPRCCAPLAAIFYSLVARKTVVLAEFTGRTGNFPTVTRTLLQKIPEADGKQSYLYDTFVCFPV